MARTVVDQNQFQSKFGMESVPVKDKNKIAVPFEDRAICCTDKYYSKRCRSRRSGTVLLRTQEMLPRDIVFFSERIIYEYKIRNVNYYV